MKGSVVKKRGRYYIVVDLDRGPDGKRRQKWVSGPAKKGWERERDAEAELGRMVQAAREGTLTLGDDLTVAGYLTHWLKSKKGNIRDSTYSEYDWAIRLYLSPKLGGIPLKKLRPLHIVDFLADMREAGKPKSSTSQRAVFDVLWMAMEQAVGWELIGSNPAHKKKVQPPSKADYHPTVLTVDQLNLLLDKTAGGRFHLPIMLGATCGMRRGEICGLRWQDVDLEGRVIRVRYSLDWKDGALQIQPVKTQRSDRPIDLSYEVAELLKKTRTRQKEAKLRLGAVYQDGGFVWCWEDGRPYDPDYFYHRFEEILAKNGLPRIRVHDLRHTHASVLLANGADIKTVQERLGHVNPGFMLKTYAHLLPGRQKVAADIMDNIRGKKRKVVGSQK